MFVITDKKREITLCANNTHAYAVITK